MHHHLFRVRSAHGIVLYEPLNKGIALTFSSPEELSFEENLEPGLTKTSVYHAVDDSVDGDFNFIKDSDSLHVMSLLKGEDFNLSRLSLHDSVILNSSI